MKKAGSEQVNCSVNHFFCALILATALSIASHAQGEESKSRFKACQATTVAEYARAQKHAANLASLGKPAIPDSELGCNGQPDIVQNPSPSSVLYGLQTTGRLISNSLGDTVRSLKDTSAFTKDLENGVNALLDNSNAKYQAWSTCPSARSDCAAKVGMPTASLKRKFAQMRIELALMSPPAAEMVANNTEGARYASVPKHPFAQLPSLRPSTPEERAQLHREFMDRLVKVVPSLKPHVARIMSGQESITLSITPLELQRAMIKIRKEARANYMAMIGDNAALMYIDDKTTPKNERGENAIANQEIAAAGGLLANELRTEKSRIGALSPQRKLEALIEYTPVVESLLTKNPQLCEAADRIAEAADKRRAHLKMTIAVSQVGAGIVSAFMCSSVIACSLATAAVSSTDYLVAAADAREAFKKGITVAATGEGLTHADGKAAMAKADTAQRMQGVSAALTVPTVVQAAIDIGTSVKAARTASEVARADARIAAMEAPPAARPAAKPLTSEVVGAEATHAGAVPSTLPKAFIPRGLYDDILDGTEGQERELIEQLIVKLRHKYSDPKKISQMIKDGLRQCVR